MRRGFELYTLHSRTTITYHVQLYKQPVLRLWIASAYHWYDMHIEKLPGVKLIDKLISNRRLKKDFEFYIPTWADRDIRCYHLMHKGRVDIINFEVTKEQYDSLK
jgi:hypothetical protein